MASRLFSPLQLGPIELANRIAVSPMCQYSAVEGNATAWHQHHLTTLGFGGAALIMVEATGVEKRGRITQHCLGLYSDENEAVLGKTLEQAKKYACAGARFGIQLAHAGRKASVHRPWEGGKPLSKQEGAWEAIAPSAIAFDEGWQVPKALELEELPKIIEAFVMAAKRAVRLGFNVIEIHSAHGYLLHEFISPLANQRQDEYGGSLENRLRFPLQIVQAVKQLLPQTVALGVRMSATDWIKEGFNLEEAIVYSKALKKIGVNYICASSGGIIHRVKIPVEAGYQVRFASAIRKEAQIITQAVGMITQPEQAEQIIADEQVIADEQADFVAIARAFLDDPRWGWHAADKLGCAIEYPPQYALARLPKWLNEKENMTKVKNF